MRERSRWDARAQLVLPGIHEMGTHEMPDSGTIDEETPELCNRVAVLLTQQAGKFLRQLA